MAPRPCSFRPSSSVPCDKVQDEHIGELDIGTDLADCDQTTSFLTPCQDACMHRAWMRPSR